MWLGHELRNSKIHMACDKGDKKGISHLVKCLVRWVPRRAEKRLLDIDAAGDTSKECAAGIKAPMNTLKLNDDDNTHLLFVGWGLTVVVVALLNHCANTWSRLVSAPQKTSM